MAHHLTEGAGVVSLMGTEPVAVTGEVGRQGWHLDVAPAAAGAVVITSATSGAWIFTVSAGGRHSFNGPAALQLTATGTTDLLNVHLERW
jgi:hypothetical protein